MEYGETALLVGGPRDGDRIDTYPGQSMLAGYRLHRVHDSRGFHRLIGLLESDPRGPMQALYEGYQKEKENA